MSSSSKTVCLRLFRRPLIRAGKASRKLCGAESALQSRPEIVEEEDEQKCLCDFKWKSPTCSPFAAFPAFLKSIDFGGDNEGFANQNIKFQSYSSRFVKMGSKMYFWVSGNYTAIYILSMDGQQSSPGGEGVVSSSSLSFGFNWNFC